MSAPHQQGVASLDLERKLRLHLFAIHTTIAVIQNLYHPIIVQPLSYLSGIHLLRRPCRCDWILASMATSKPPNASLVYHLPIVIFFPLHRPYFIAQRSSITGPFVAAPVQSFLDTSLASPKVVSVRKLYFLLTYIYVCCLFVLLRLSERTQS